MSVKSAKPYNISYHTLSMLLYYLWKIKVHFLANTLCCNKRQPLNSYSGKFVKA